MSNDKAIHPGQEPFTVGYFRPEDAEGIVCLFHAVHGDGYPIRLFYDPATIIAANRDDRHYSIVARTASGDVVGVTYLYHPAPGQSLDESGSDSRPSQPIEIEEYTHARFPVNQ